MVLRFLSPSIKHSQGGGGAEARPRGAARLTLRSRPLAARSEVVAMKSDLEAAHTALEEKSALVGEIERLKKAGEDAKLHEVAMKEEISRLKTERAEDKATITRIETAKIRGR